MSDEIGQDFSTIKEKVYFTLGPEYVIVKVLHGETLYGGQRSL